MYVYLGTFPLLYFGKCNPPIISRQPQGTLTKKRSGNIRQKPFNNHPDRKQTRRTARKTDRKNGTRHAPEKGTPCRGRNCTLRKVLEYLPQSTLRTTASRTSCLMRMKGGLKQNKLPRTTPRSRASKPSSINALWAASPRESKACDPKKGITLGSPPCARCANADINDGLRTAGQRRAAAE